MEISEVLFSYLKKASDVFRIDSFFLSKQFLQDENLISRHKNLKLSKMCTSLKSFGAYSLNNFVEYLDTGIPFIRGVNMKNGFLDFSDVICISKDAHKLLWKSEVFSEDILLSMSGTIGDVAIAMPTLKYPLNSNQDIAKIHLKSEYNPYCVYAFLLSKYGQNYLLREARGSVQQHVFLSQIENFSIPIFTEPFQNKIAEMVKSAHNKLEQSKILYKQAEEILEKELGIDFESLTKKKSVEFSIVNSQSSIFSSGRLDAEYYQEKYDKIEYAIKKYKGGWNYLNAVTKIYDKNILPSDNVFYSYIELANIGANGEVNGCTKSLGADLPARARRLVHSGDVLVSSIEGSLQSCAIVGEEFDGAFCSTGFYVLSPEKLNKETLLLLMKSSPIQALLKRGCNGTILTSISKEEFSEIPIPIIPKDIQSAIAEKITESFRLREESKQLLEDAKLAVEREIEK